MADQYPGVSITGYNSNPPADDGSQTEANRVKWSTIKSKITDPVKTRTDDMDAALIAAFGKIDGGITSTGINYTVLSTDQGKMVRATAAGITITTPDATDVDAPFVFGFLNDSTGDVILDGSGSQTIDGDGSVTVPPGCGFRVRTDGTNWFTEGQNFQRTQVPPQGYLTLLSIASQPLSPMANSDQSGKTAVYYRPFRGNLMPIPNGTSHVVREFSELTLTLVSNHVANGIYDVFAFDDSGTIRIGTGPVWNTVTAGSGARGTGAGTTELDVLKGLPVNKNAMTARNGSTTYSVAALSAIYLGSISIDGSAGQVSCLPQANASRKWGVWNAYNRLPIRLLNFDGTSSWTTTATTWESSRGQSANSCQSFCGLADEAVDIAFEQNIRGSTTSASLQAHIGIGINSTSAISGCSGIVESANAAGFSNTVAAHAVARHTISPMIGINTVNMLQQVPSGGVQNTFLGTSANIKMTTMWMG